MNPAASSSPGAPAFPAPRVTPDARHAFGGIWRLTVRRHFTVGHWLALLGTLVLLVLFALGSSAGSHGPANYLKWAAGFYVGFLVPVLAFISAGGAIRDDLTPGTVDYVFTRPVPRPAFLLFRYLSHLACAQIDFLFALAVVAAVGVFRHAPELWTTLPWLAFAQFLVIAVFGAFGFLAAAVTSRYVIVGLCYGAIVEVGIGNVPTQLNRLSMIRQVADMLRPVVRLDDAAAVAASASATAATAGLLLLVTAGLLAVAATVISLKELAGAAGRDA